MLLDVLCTCTRTRTRTACRCCECCVVSGRGVAAASVSAAATATGAAAAERERRLILAFSVVQPVLMIFGQPFLCSDAVGNPSRVDDNLRRDGVIIERTSAQGVQGMSAQHVQVSPLPVQSREDLGRKGRQSTLLGPWAQPA